MADEIDIPLARMSSGKTSAETTQAKGPQVTAKLAMGQQSGRRELGRMFSPMYQ